MPVTINSPGSKYEQFLKQIPTEHKRYKCYTCFAILDQPDLNDGKCPICGEKHIVEMCPLDHNGCKHEIMDKIAYCPICGKAICPECGDHNVVQISRVTGYLQDVSGWNNGKLQELKDRTRTNIGNNGEISAPIKTIKLKKIIA
jgi:DNA-directed RNA polymerase subunit RPC12/RpoP